MLSVADREAAPETVADFADQLAWLAGQSGVSDESAGSEWSTASAGLGVPLRDPLIRDSHAAVKTGSVGDAPPTAV
jgi:hypothetical protein